MESLSKIISNVDKKPTFSISTESGDSVTCLFDTGADVPVFTKGEKVLLSLYPSAELVEGYSFEISGFGKDVEFVPLYRIPVFRIESDYDNTYIEFINLPIACCSKERIKSFFIVSSTMFSHTDYKVYNIGNDSKKIRIWYDNNTFYMKDLSYGDMTYGVCAFTQDDV